ncbi:GroES-like protein [Neocallimastix californiae]|uniref:GroES-like protein n=1 Tax=Neocallimastix californiae TaxID=1754190 RepID=A0A1Y1ZN74_9FUNG|nr:GroES-like protein [Neocallimastix californiae]|eukprot:ORY11275.1 GroES-like protein [Neocallimastix californiae]
MTTKVKGYKVEGSQFSNFGVSLVERRALRDDDVEIDIKYCGICHSDIMIVQNNQPGNGIVPGHEIAGVVKSVGKAVTNFKVGDHVGIGCFVNSCSNCEYCKRGDEQFCDKGVVIVFNSKDYDGAITYGGYTQTIIVRDKFVLHIPESLDLAMASPLLCAGVTTYSPLKRYNIGKGSRVAIMGLGGLGHLGVQFAHAMGAEVTVLGHSESKKEEAKKLGADYNHIKLLKPNGVLCFVSIVPEEQKFTEMNLFGNQATITVSNVGGIDITQEMLNFSAEKGIKPMIEMIKVKDIPEAYQKIIDCKVHYRYVIDMSSIDDMPVEKN